jgi:predicted NACHT family NTPase
VTRVDLAELFKKITRYYSNFQSDDVDKFNDWYAVLKDMPYLIVLQNLNRHVSLSKYSPTIAELAVIRDVQQNNHEISMQETDQRVAEFEQWLTNAAPPPPGLRERIFGHARD